jgi:predicted amidophosphoribosyltransferase
MGKCAICDKFIKGDGLCYDCERDNNKIAELGSWHKKNCSVEYCIDKGFQPINDKVYCYRHYQKEYANNYKLQATPEQVNRFLAKVDSKSISDIVRGVIK